MFKLRKKIKIKNEKMKKILSISAKFNSIFLLLFIFLSILNLINKIENIDDFFNFQIQKRSHKKFIRFCSEGKLHKPLEKITNISNPDISIFLPTYNKANFIERVIRSIQNQNFKNLEMIFINDYSKDKTSEVLEHFKLEDPRIRIVNNTRNHGSMYSRAMGIINSKGKYLLAIDPDDMLASPDILSILFNKAEKLNLDIIEFDYIEGEINKFIHGKFNHSERGIIKQPLLENYMYYEKSDIKLKLSNVYIWNKFVKREVYIKLYNILKNVINGSNFNYYDDTLWAFVLMRISKNYTYINKIGYFFNKNDQSLRRSNYSGKIQLMLSNCMEYVQSLYNLTKNDEHDKKIPVYEFKQCLIRDDLYTQINGFLKEKVLLTAKIFTDSLYISSQDKELLTNDFNTIKHISDIEEIYEEFDKTIILQMFKYINFESKTEYFQYHIKNYIKQLSKMKFDNKGKSILKLDKNLFKAKISIFIYLKEKSLESLKILLNSIENQSIDKIEVIILINHNKENFSKHFNDYDLSNIKFIIIKEKNFRIEILRSFIKNSNGQFVLFLKNGDLLLNKEILKISYHFGIKYNINIVEFVGSEKNKKNILLLNNYNCPFKIINNTELIYRIFSSFQNNKTLILSNMLINKETILNAFDFLGEGINNYNFKEYFNEIMLFGIFSVANNFTNIPIIGHYYDSIISNITQRKFKDIYKCFSEKITAFEDIFKSNLNYDNSYKDCENENSINSYIYHRFNIYSKKLNENK